MTDTAQPDTGADAVERDADIADDNSIGTGDVSAAIEDELAAAKGGKTGDKDSPASIKNGSTTEDTPTATEDGTTAEETPATADSSSPAPAPVPPPPDAMPPVPVPPPPSAASASVPPPPGTASVSVPPPPDATPPVPVPPPLGTASAPATPTGAVPPTPPTPPTIIRRPRRTPSFSPAPPGSRPVIDRKDLLARTRDTTGGPKLSSDRAMAGGLPEWSPLPPNEMIVRRPPSEAR